MTLFEYSIARTYKQYCEQSKERALTARESVLIDYILEPLVVYYRDREMPSPEGVHATVRDRQRAQTASAEWR